MIYRDACSNFYCLGQKRPNLNDERELMLLIKGEYEYDQKLSWKCNLGRALWYVNPDIKEALEFVLERANAFEGEDGSKPTDIDDPLMLEILLLYCQPEKVDMTFFRERGIDQQNSLVRRTMWSVVTCLRVSHLFSGFKTIVYKCADI